MRPSALIVDLQARERAMTAVVRSNRVFQPRQLAGKDHVSVMRLASTPDAPDSQLVAGAIACPVHASMSCPAWISVAKR